jgi:Fe-S cluster biogenesis protein NfuA
MLDKLNAQEMVQKIEAALAIVRPFVLQHGGDITFVRYEDTIVYVELHGACVGCPVSLYTLQLGVETEIKRLIPDVTSVVSINKE